MELESISPLGRCQDWPGYVNQESIYQTMFTKVTFSFHFYQIFIVFSYQTDMSTFIIGWRGRLQNTDTRYLHFLLTFTNTSEVPFSASVYNRSFVSFVEIKQKFYLLKHNANEMTTNFRSKTSIRYQLFQKSKPFSIVGAKAKIDISSLSQYLQRGHWCQRWRQKLSLYLPSTLPL